MAERRRGKQKKQQDGNEKPTKEEYAVAKFLRFNVPIKEGKLVGMTVQYFIASKAVDALLDSKWGGEKSKGEALFTSRSSCVDYCDRLLQKGLFHRALKVEKKRDKEGEKKKKRVKDVEEKEDGEKKTKREKKTKKGKEKETEKEEIEEGEGEEKEEKEKKASPKSEKKEEKKDDEKKKRKDKKLKLEMHNHQVFKDGDEVYVWIYDPVPLKTFIIGLFLVLGAIGVCLFPLWPPEVRLGVYYLSMVAAGFVGFILVLCVVRLILFCIVWAATFGKHYFWFLPNLTEDVGFFESFKPLYKHDYYGNEEKDEKGVKSKDSKEEKDSIEEKSTAENSTEKEKDLAEQEAIERQLEGDEEEIPDEEEGREGGSPTGSEGNGYEIVDADDLEEDVGDLEDEDEEYKDEPKKTK